jgi:hypothetical protein
MKNIWLNSIKRWRRLEATTGFAIRKDPEVQEQITCFLEELCEVIGDQDISEVRGDFRWLYDKYPKTRIGIRRAILMADKMREEKKCLESN